MAEENAVEQEASDEEILRTLDEVNAALEECRPKIEALNRSADEMLAKVVETKARLDIFEEEAARLRASFAV